MYMDVHRHMGFDDFLRDISNDSAYSSIIEAVQSIGDKVSNPQFIWGPSGVGKTHLLYAARGLAKQLYPQAHVLLRDADELSDEMVAVIRDYPRIEGEDLWRRLPEYLGCDLLLIDNLHPLEGKLAVQYEFLRFFRQKKMPVILVSELSINRYPVLQGTFFEVHELSLPSHSLKYAWIRNQAARMNLVLDESEIKRLVDTADTISRLRGELNLKAVV